MPRHPPIALSSLSIIYKDARVHCEILKKRASPPPTSHQQATRPANGPQEGATNRQPTLQDPTTCHRPNPAPTQDPFHTNTLVVLDTPGRTRPRLGQCLPHQSPHQPTPHTGMKAGTIPPSEEVTSGLPRKEVIQPHLPVRLPCYDLVLITDPTFDGSPHKGWATGFGCYRLS